MNTAGTIRKAIPALALFLAFGAPLAAAAADDKKIDVGKFEYEGSCAVCHGLTGKGAGPMASQLKTPTPDITVLARNNKGVFPFDRVYQIIDGRQMLEAHGSREMPIWGRAFRQQSSVFFDSRVPHDSESSARSRILALTEYVYRLQGK
jgi:mono/diheme cytochrome c family protein